MIKINLLPQEMVRRKKIGSFIIFVSMCGLLGILICIFLFFPIIKEVELTQSQLTLVKGEVSQCQSRLSELKKLENERVELRSRLEAIKGLAIDRGYWPRVLYTISKSLPPNIWLTRLNKAVQGKEDILIIEGSSLTQTVDIARFIENLNNSPLLREVRFLTLSKRMIGGTEVSDFKISCKLMKSAR
jgi:type IV pilus assembly protein PilN